MYFSGEILNNPAEGSTREWLLTNGLGGFAAGTAVGANTRRYHGLLVAALHPPVSRVLLLAKLEEEMDYQGKTHRLATNFYHPDTVHPEGCRRLVSFGLAPFPIFTFFCGGALLSREIFMEHGRNRTIIVYRVLHAEEPVKLRAYPLVNCRDYHGIIRENDWPFRQELRAQSGHGPGLVAIQAYAGSPVLALAVTGGTYQPAGMWYRNMEYPVERERGLDFVEDHYNPGYFEVTLEAGEVWAVSAALAGEQGGSLPDRPDDRAAGNGSASDGESFDVETALEIRAREVERRERLWQAVGAWPQRGVEMAKTDPKASLTASPATLPGESLLDFARQLVLAADAFIVRRESTGARSIIAGYPWFTDWGRDTMISLPGLTLVTGRFDEAREILRTFSGRRRDGLVPNRFTDLTGEAEYNTVDASLWFVQAVYQYARYTGDRRFVESEMLPVIREIIAAYQKGTRFNIHMEEDSLVAAGERGLQLTWMDAKVGDWVVTPREGKAVEINALWYNALRVAAWLCRLAADDQLTEGRVKEWAQEYEKLAEHVRDGFQREFWAPDRGYLIDVVTPGGGKDYTLRPNQILAVSLPFSPLNPGQMKQVVEVVFRRLYTPFGLRSLAREEPAYIGRYTGNQVSRDAAYHQGTVWSWLIGPFITAFVRVYGRGGPDQTQSVSDGFLTAQSTAQTTAYAAALTMLRPFETHLREAGLGTISEVFEGDEPYLPKGCFAQAWGVAELLRCYLEDVLGVRPDNYYRKTE
ncbi:MAG: glycogen debranching enzyme N-terminal domain-containing protein [Firmicutes bacterium]|nr:glycogen debranching enzyme N-terminal domain-containing protein [Bacillota bacterium]